MNYLITAAGIGSRFLKEGIKSPKPLIKVFGNELLIWSLNSFNISSSDKVFIVTLKQHKVKEKIGDKINNIYPDVPVFWFEMEELQNGQLFSTIKAIRFFDIKGAITIHNCDTFHKFDDYEINNFLKNDLFGIIPCFEGDGNHWSFVRTSSIDSFIALEVTEKKRISNNCSVGTYVFSSASTLIDLFKDYINSNKFSEEYFIAPIYQYAIEKNFRVMITKAKSVKIFGTPKELLSNFKINFDQLLGENSWNGHHPRTLIVDIDKTICVKNKFEDYSLAIPNQEVCKSLKKANSEGVYIILFTSRNMKTFKGSLGLINKYTAPVLLKWLSDYSIPYDEIYYGKPWGNDVSYIDDKNYSIEEFIKDFK